MIFVCGIKLSLDSDSGLTEDVNHKSNATTSHFTPTNNSWLAFTYVGNGGLVLFSKGSRHDTYIGLHWLQVDDINEVGETRIKLLAKYALVVSLSVNGVHLINKRTSISQHIWNTLNLALSYTNLQR